MPGDLGYPRNQIDPDSEKGKGVMAEKILIVVDMQKDFVNGSLGSKDAEAIVPAVVKKAETFDEGHTFRELYGYSGGTFSSGSSLY